jgi:peptidoglycan/LPS O-acetylase OafA/YrhL
LPPAEKHKNTPLELLRGLAALAVLFAHLAINYDCMGKTGWGHALGAWGISAVVVFFMLSGVVIRLSTEGRGMSRAGFLYRRALRIIPIFFLACSLSLLVERFCLDGKLTEGVVAGHYLFLATLQGWIVEVTPANPALWSLTYEVAFYLAFAVCMGAGQKPKMAIWCLMGVIALCAYQAMQVVPQYGQQLWSILAYSTIWLLGYFLVSLARNRGIPFSLAIFSFGLVPMISRTPVFGGYLDPGQHLLLALATVPMFVYCLQSERPAWPLKHYFVVWSVAISITSAITVWHLSQSASLAQNKYLYVLVPWGLLALSFPLDSVFRNTALGSVLGGVGLFLGGISYALYVFHFPIILICKQAFGQNAHSLLVAIGATIVTSAILEYYVQPRVIRRTKLWVAMVVPKPLRVRPE